MKSLSKQDIAARVMAYSGVLGAIRLFRRVVPNQDLLILAYHRVLKTIPETFPLDRDLVSALESDFEKQVQYVRRYCSPITFADLGKIVFEGRSLPPNPVIVTFDDGYKDNYSVAYPILKKYDVPATFFVATGYINNRRLFWWDEVANLIGKTKKEILEVPGFDITQLPLMGKGEKAAAVRAVLGLCVRLPDARRQELIRSIGECLGLSADHEAADNELLTWDDIRTMAANGFEFGAHTVSHPILTRIDEKQQRLEILESKEELERRLGKPVNVFAYPVGTEACVSNDLASMVGRLGFSFAVTYIGGTNPHGGYDPYQLRRLHVEIETTLERFQAGLLFPKRFCYP